MRRLLTCLALVLATVSTAGACIYCDATCPAGLPIRIYFDGKWFDDMPPKAGGPFSVHLCTPHGRRSLRNARFTGWAGAKMRFDASQCEFRCRESFLLGRRDDGTGEPTR